MRPIETIHVAPSRRVRLAVAGDRERPRCSLAHFDLSYVRRSRAGIAPDRAVDHGVRVAYEEMALGRVGKAR